MTISTPLKSWPKVKGRPRSFTDEMAFEAVMRVAQDHGFTRLTLAAVAKDIGCTGQALNARFGSRMGLLVAYADWAIDRDVDRFRQVRATASSPLEAIRARFMLPVAGREEELSDSGNQIRMLSLIAEAHLNPDLTERMQERNVVFEHQLSLLVDEAVRAGELKVDQPEELAHLLTVTTLGASALWSITGSGSVLDEITRIVDSALAPYRAHSGD